ncbi:MAG: hypothetical protein V7739_09285 [Motiliproteus sp.]
MKKLVILLLILPLSGCGSVVALFNYLDSLIPRPSFDSGTFEVALTSKKLEINEKLLIECEEGYQNSFSTRGGRWEFQSKKQLPAIVREIDNYTIKTFYPNCTSLIKSPNKPHTTLSLSKDGKEIYRTVVAYPKNYSAYEQELINSIPTITVVRVSE